MASARHLPPLPPAVQYLLLGLFVLGIVPFCQAVGAVNSAFFIFHAFAFGVIVDTESKTLLLATLPVAVHVSRRGITRVSHRH
jgi:hypothetical protein